MDFACSSPLVEPFGSLGCRLNSVFITEQATASTVTVRCMLRARLGVCHCVTYLYGTSRHLQSIDRIGNNNKLWRLPNYIQSQTITRQPNMGIRVQPAQRRANLKLCISEIVSSSYLSISRSSNCQTRLMARINTLPSIPPRPGTRDSSVCFAVHPSKSFPRFSINGM
jgi:hypothetical protein